jgi:hypothetical protein
VDEEIPETVPAKSLGVGNLFSFEFCFQFNLTCNAGHEGRGATTQNF